MMEVWGKAEIHADVATKRRLLNQFAPGGPEGSPDIVFGAVRPVRAL